MNTRKHLSTTAGMLLEIAMEELFPNAAREEIVRLAKLLSDDTRAGRPHLENKEAMGITEVMLKKYNINMDVFIAKAQETLQRIEAARQDKLNWVNAVVDLFKRAREWSISYGIWLRDYRRFQAIVKLPKNMKFTTEAEARREALEARQNQLWNEIEAMQAEHAELARTNPTDESLCPLTDHPIPSRDALVR